MNTSRSLRSRVPSTAAEATTQVFLRTAILVNGIHLVDEGCNTDDAPGEETVIASIADVEPGALCGRPACLPRIEGHPEAGA